MHEKPTMYVLPAIVNSHLSYIPVCKMAKNMALLIGVHHFTADHLRIMREKLGYDVIERQPEKVK